MTLLTVVLIGGVLYFAQDVLIPFALAILLSFLLAPLVDLLERWRLHRIPAVIITAIISFSAIGGLGFVVTDEAVDLAESLPDYKSNLLDRIQSLEGPASGSLNRTLDAAAELTDELKKGSPGKPDSADIAKVQIVDSPSAFQVARGMAGPLIKPLGTLAVVILFVIFMLLKSEDMRDRLIRLLGTGDLNLTTRALNDAASRVSRYLLMQALINGGHGLVVAIGLYFIGVPNAALWGMLSALLRFIPYVGPWIAAVFPIALSFAVFDNWTLPLITIGLFVTLELISNNVVEPWLYGTHTGISAIALIVAAVFWTWLWGVAGLFLSTPMTVCLMVLGKYIPQLEFLSVLLGDKPVLEPHERFYQRLLAKDPDEAAELIEEFLKEKSPIEVCDSVILPAMRLAEEDHDSGKLWEDRRRYLHDQILELADEIVPPRDPPSEPTSLSAISVLCLPARDIADETAAVLFAKLLSQHGLNARAASIAALSGEKLDLVTEHRADVVCVSAMPPAAMTHARYLVKRLKTRFAQTPIIVGLWNAHDDAERARLRLQSAGADKVVTSYADGLTEVKAVAAPILEGVEKRDAAAGNLEGGDRSLNPAPTV